jgi:diaphanous 1
MTHIAYSLHGASTKLRSLSSDVLAAICYVSPTEGHKAVLAAMSDYRVEFNEKFRFHELIGSLRLPDTVTDGESSGMDQAYATEEDGAWEARTASMAFINALTNFPDSLEERILLREEFTRRGLNEVLVVCEQYELFILIVDARFISDFAVCETARSSGYTVRYIHGGKV